MQGQIRYWFSAQVIGCAWRRVLTSAIAYITAPSVESAGVGLSPTGHCCFAPGYGSSIQESAA